MKKYQHYIDVWGEVLPTQYSTTTAVLYSRLVYLFDVANGIMYV